MAPSKTVRYTTPFRYGTSEGMFYNVWNFGLTDPACDFLGHRYEVGHFDDIFVIIG